MTLKRLLSHVELTLAVNPEWLICEVVQRMDQRAGENVEPINTRTYVVDGVFTMIARQYKEKLPA